MWRLKQVECELGLCQKDSTIVNPSKSAYEVLEGQFNYNSTLLTPPGTKALIFKATSQRTAWGPHAVDGWYLGPAMKHYRCSRYFIDHTRAIRISNTVKLLPSHCKMPTISKEDNTIIAAEEIMKGISEKLGAEEIFKHK